MECPECGGEMIWQNDWDIADDGCEDDPNLQTAYICSNEDCDVCSIDVYRKIK